MDTVTVTSVTYDSAAKTLTVAATSSAQPNVTLTATGYGNLPWRSTNNLYRNTFTGVNTKPASVTVVSSNGGSATYNLPAGDTVSIVSVTYDFVNKTLTVAATSSAQPNVALTATGYGNLPWRSTNNFYRMTFTNVNTKPNSVTVTSSGGGSATYTFPAADTVTITNVTYSTASGGTLTVAATSSAQPNVSLTATGYGALGWRSWLNIYRTTFTGIGAKPANVTVTSSGGGSATAVVP